MPGNCLVCCSGLWSEVANENNIEGVGGLVDPRMYLGSPHSPSGLDFQAQRGVAPTLPVASLGLNGTCKLTQKFRVAQFHSHSREK